MVRVSKKLRKAIKLDDRTQYRIALSAGLSPVVLSHWLVGYSCPKVDDQRIIKVAKLVGVEITDCFEEVQAIL